MRHDRGGQQRAALGKELLLARRVAEVRVRVAEVDEQPPHLGGRRRLLLLLDREEALEELRHLGRLANVAVGVAEDVERVDVLGPVEALLDAERALEQRNLLGRVAQLP